MRGASRPQFAGNGRRALPSLLPTLIVRDPRSCAGARCMIYFPPCAVLPPCSNGSPGPAARALGRFTSKAGVYAPPATFKSMSDSPRGWPRRAFPTLPFLPAYRMRSLVRLLFHSPSVGALQDRAQSRAREDHLLPPHHHPQKCVPYASPSAALTAGAERRSDVPRRARVPVVRRPSLPSRCLLSTGHAYVDGPPATVSTYTHSPIACFSRAPYSGGRSTRGTLSVVDVADAPARLALSMFSTRCCSAGTRQLHPSRPPRLAILKFVLQRVPCLTSGLAIFSRRAPVPLAAQMLLVYKFVYGRLGRGRADSWYVAGGCVRALVDVPTPYGGPRARRPYCAMFWSRLAFPRHFLRDVGATRETAASGPECLDGLPPPVDGGAGRASSLDAGAYHRRRRCAVSALMHSSRLLRAREVIERCSCDARVVCVC